jgi:hypothetical protein
MSEVLHPRNKKIHRPLFSVKILHKSDKRADSAFRSPPQRGPTVRLKINP